MKLGLTQDLETLEQLIVNCINAWQLGYDAGGHQNFVQAIHQMGSTLEAHFEELENHLNPLVLILERLHTFVQRKDIMAVQDVVEYEWYPLISEWKRRWTAQ